MQGDMDRGKVSRGREGNRNSEHMEAISNSRRKCGTISTKIATVKNKDWRILDNKEDIKQRWKQNYEELYNNVNPVDRTVLEELPVCNEHEKKHDLRPSPHNFLLPLRDDTNYILWTLFRWLRPNP